MGTCLTDQDLAAHVLGSATPEQFKAWMSHIATCETCAQKVASQDGEAPERPKPVSTSTSTGGIAPGTRLGDFEIEKRIGSGGMGIRVPGSPSLVEPACASNVLPPGRGMTSSAVARFHREAQAAKRHHTNIVAVYAEGEHDATFFYAIVLIQGRALDEIIAERQDPGTTVVGSSYPTLTLGATPPGRVMLEATAVFG